MLIFLRVLQVFDEPLVESKNRKEVKISQSRLARYSGENG